MSSEQIPPLPMTRTGADHRRVLLTVVNLPTPNIGGHSRIVLELLKAPSHGGDMPRFEPKALFQRYLVDGYDKALALGRLRGAKTAGRSTSPWTVAKRFMVEHSSGIAYLAYRRHLSSISKALQSAKERDQPTLIHSHEFITAVLASGACPSIPLIFTSHYKGSGVTEHLIPKNPHYSGNLMEDYLRRLERQAFRNASAVTFPSAGAKRLLEEDYPQVLQGKDVRIIHNGIDISYIDSVKPDPQLESKYGCENKHLLVCVAAHVKEKGLSYLIDAIERLEVETRNSVRLLLVGDGYLRADLEKAIHQKGLDKSITMVGRVPHLEVMQLLKLSSAFVLPSLESVFDLALLEAMAANTPIVTTSVGGNLEMLSADSALLVPPRDSQALANAVDSIVNEPGLASDLARQARKRVTTHFSLEGMLSKYFALYEEVIGQGTGTRLSFVKST